MTNTEQTTRTQLKDFFQPLACSTYCGSLESGERSVYFIRRDVIKVQTLLRVINHEPLNAWALLTRPNIEKLLRADIMAGTFFPMGPYVLVRHMCLILGACIFR